MSHTSFVVIPHIQPLSVILFKIPTLSCKVLLVMVSPPTKKACACASNISDLLLKQINSVWIMNSDSIKTNSEMQHLLSGKQETKYLFELFCFCYEHRITMTKYSYSLPYNPIRFTPTIKVINIHPVAVVSDQSPADAISSSSGAGIRGWNRRHGTNAWFWKWNLQTGNVRYITYLAVMY